MTIFFHRFRHFIGFFLGMLLSFGKLYAQPTDSLGYRPVVSVALSTSFFGVATGIQAGIANPHHTWLAGFGYRPFHGTKRFVFGALYQYFPNPPARRFNLFFQVETEMGQVDSRFLTALYGGYGLAIRLGKSAWFRTNYGLGLMQGKKHNNFFPNTSIDLAGNLRFGFGMRF